MERDQKYAFLDRSQVWKVPRILAGRKCGNINQRVTLGPVQPELRTLPSTHPVREVGGHLRVYRGRLSCTGPHVDWCGSVHKRKNSDFPVQRLPRGQWLWGGATVTGNTL